MPCVHAYVNVQVQFDKLEEHMKLQCRKRQMYCRLGCGQTFTAQFEASHNKRVRVC